MILVETPEVTKERILLLKKVVVVLFAILAGMLIQSWRGSQADGAFPLEVVKAQVKVKATDGFAIFEIRPELKRDEEGYIKVVSDAEYPLGNLTILYQPKINLRPTIVEPSLELRPVPESPKATTETKPAAKVKARLERGRKGVTRRVNSRGLPPLPPTIYDLK